MRQYINGMDRWILYFFKCFVWGVRLFKCKGWIGEYFKFLLPYGTGLIYENQMEIGFSHPQKRSGNVKKTFHKNVPRTFQLNVLTPFRERSKNFRWTFCVSCLDTNRNSTLLGHQIREFQHHQLFAYILIADQNTLWSYNDVTLYKHFQTGSTKLKQLKGSSWFSLSLHC